MDHLFHDKKLSAGIVFNDNYVETKAMYLSLFGTIPDISYISRIDGEKAYATFMEQYKHFVLSHHSYRWYEQGKPKSNFDQTVVILNNNCLLEFDTYYCKIMHRGDDDGFVATLCAFLSKFKQRRKRQPFEVNLIVREYNKLVLKPMEIKRTKLDIGLFYDDDFPVVDETIRTRLNRKGDKGIVLLHGLPGTGKTTYLRYLIGKVRKRVLFLSSNAAGDLMDPSFIQLLIDHPNTVVVIEDAENVIMDRRYTQSAAVSNLLNISDGLLADFLNVQLICTFNSSVTMVDNALMRKGRLIAKYEFGKLPVAKAQVLSDRLGFDSEVTEPMTVAEIANQQEPVCETRQVEVIGFRRNVFVN